MLHLLQRLSEHADRLGDALAFKEVFGGMTSCRALSYRDLAQAVAVTARRIEGVVSTGGVVIISLPNVIECPVAFLAALQANRAAFLINSSVTGSELACAAERSAAQAIISGNGSSEETLSAGLPRIPIDLTERSKFDPAAKTADAALLLLSSGTTQEPKIVYRDGASLDALARNCVEAIGVNRRDRVLLSIPLCHSYGVEHGILTPVYAGAAVHLARGMDPNAILPELGNGDVSLIPGVPAMYEMLAGLSEPPRCESIRCAYSAGAPLPSSIFEACRDRIGVRIGQLYGSSEVGSATFNQPRRPDHDPMSVGAPMDGVEVRIVNPDSRDLSAPLPPGAEGEVAIRSPSMLRRYIGQSSSCLAEGFFFTEDLGKLSASGDLTITGRIKLLIDVGAMKVNPIEVEQTIVGHPAIAACLVVGLPISQTVQRLKAMVVPKDKCAPPDTCELRAYVRERLSPHKIPRVIEVVDALPRSPTGKVLRRVPTS
jgi:acyl-CoA synthetase (AMP-forming)/AMP-acid ligase II